MKTLHEKIRMEEMKPIPKQTEKREVGALPIRTYTVLPDGIVVFGRGSQDDVQKRYIAR